MRQSTVIKRSVIIRGHKTSVSLEDGFWHGLREIAAERNTRLSELVAEINQQRLSSNLSSALRLFVLEAFRRRAESKPYDLRQRTVLVVDDDPMVLRLAADMLGNLGCDVRTASDGTQALPEIERDQRIQVLIADVEMPGLRGNQIAQRAKQIRAGLQIVLMSGHESDPGGLPIIRKPFFEADLERVMRQIGPVNALARTTTATCIRHEQFEAATGLLKDGLRSFLLENAVARPSDLSQPF